MVSSAKNSKFDSMQKMITQLQEEVLEINNQRERIRDAEIEWLRDNELHLQRINQVKCLQQKLEEYCRLLKKIKDMAHREIDKFVIHWNLSGLKPDFGEEKQTIFKRQLKVRTR